MRRIAIVLLLAFTACAGVPRSGADRTLGASFENVRTEGIHLELIEQMLVSRRAFAALAHLDALTEPEKSSEKALWLRAEALRQVGEIDASRRFYQGLLDGEHAGLAHRGLGLLAAAAGQTSEAIEHLEWARKYLPTDARVRNDLGYAYLMSRRYEDARTELRTAIELNHKDSVAISNMLLLLYLVGDARGAAAWVYRHEVDARTNEIIRREAERLSGQALIERSELNGEGQGSVLDETGAAGGQGAGTEASVDPALASESHCCAAALQVSEDEPFVSAWLELQRSGACAGSAPRLPSAAGVRIYREYLSSFSEPLGANP